MESIIVKPQLQIGFVNRSNPYKNYDHAAAMCLGRFDTRHIYRIFIRFSTDIIPADALVIEAKFKMCASAVGCGQPNINTPYAVTQDWMADTITWCNQPSFDTKIAGEDININRASQYTFNITNIVKTWQEKKEDNYGLVIKNKESVDYSYTKVLTELNRAYSPVVEIKYILKYKCECKVISAEFIEKVEKLTTDDDFNYSVVNDTSLIKDLTYFIKNTGENDMTAKLQISPNNVDFADDNAAKVIAPGEIVAVVPYIFSKFTRVAVKNVVAGKNSSAKIWYQAQR